MARSVDAVRRGVGARGGGQVVVVAVVDERVTEDEEGARSRGQRNAREDGHEREEQQWVSHTCQSAWCTHNAEEGRESWFVFFFIRVPLS